MCEPCKITQTNLERRTAVIANELKRYSIAIAALSETRLPGTTELTERSAGYTFYCSGRPENEPRQAGVGFAIKTEHLKLLECLPRAVNERLMVMRLKLAYTNMTLISAYAPTMDYPHEDKERFYEELDRLIQDTPHSDKLFLLGDFNARVGDNHEAWERVLGKHGMGKENANGTLLLTTCAQNQLIITNTMFQQRNLFKGTWMHPRSHHWHQIDFIITRQRDAQDTHLTRAMRGTTAFSDHRMLRSKVALLLRPPMRNRRQEPGTKKFNVRKLQEPTVKEELSTCLDEKLRDLSPMRQDVEGYWTKLRDILSETAEKVLGFAKRAHRDWFDENDTSTKELLDNLHTAHLEYVNHKDSAMKKNAYLQLKRTAQATLRKMKDKWWCDRARDLQEAADRHDSKALFDGLKAVYGPTSRGSTPLLTADGQGLLRDQNSLLARWVEHFDGVLNRISHITDDALAEIPQRPILYDLDACPSLYETRKAIEQMSSGKAAGPDGIPAEIFKCGGKILTARLKDLFAAIWDNGGVPQGYKDVLIIHLYKNKGDRRCCDNHRGISLLSIAGKILARIIINRLTKHITEHVTPESQCGFRASRGTTDMLFAARQIQEKCVEQKKELFVVFVDLTKAFDSVSREGLWKILGKAGCPPKITKIIRSFHDNMYGRVLNDGVVSDPFQIRNGTKQGCVMAPVLFSLVFSAMLEDAFHNCQKGVSINLRTDGGVFNLRRLKAQTKTKQMLLRDLLYADDCALVAHTLEDAQEMVSTFSRASTRYGLTISIRKTEVLHQPLPGAPPREPLITIGDEPLKSVPRFCYLGGMIAQNARIDDEITSRIAKASASFGRLQHRLWKERGVRLSTKIAVYKAAVLSTLLYGGETWVQYRAHIKKLEQFHMRCLRKICGVSWRDHIPNTEILSRCQISSIEAILIRSQLRWCGHLVRMGDERIPKALFYGELSSGKRSTGGQRKRYKDVLKASLKSCGIDPAAWEELAQDRPRWRQTLHDGSRRFEEARTEKLIEKRRRRHEAAARPTNLPQDGNFTCNICFKPCASRIGLFSHKRFKHPQ